MWVSLGGSLFSDWTHPITGEPIPRSNSTSLGGSLFSDRTYPITGEPIPRSSTRLESDPGVTNERRRQRRGSDS